MDRKAPTSRNPDRLGQRHQDGGLATNIPSLFASASVHHRAGDLIEAAALYLKIMALAPDHVGSLHLYGVTALQSGDMLRASFWLSAAIRLDPANEDQHYHQGLTFQTMGRVQEALRCYRIALCLRPTYWDAENNLANLVSTSADSLALYRRAICQRPDSSETHYNLGCALDARGALRDAAQHYRVAIALRPNYPKAYNNLGTIVRGFSGTTEAMVHFARAICLAPDNTDAHNNFGLALHAQGSYRQGIAFFMRILVLKPESAEGYNNIGIALNELGLLETALVHYIRSLRISGDIAEIHYNIALLLQNAAQLPQAVVHYFAALSLNPCHALAHNNLGLCFESLGQRYRAPKSYLRALAENPQYADAHSNFAMWLENQGQVAPALTHYHTALAISPSAPKTFSNMGNLSKNLGRLDDAVLYFNRALTLQPDFATVYSNLLFLCAEQGSLVPSDYLALARGWEGSSVPLEQRNQRLPARVEQARQRLRVGYVSGDLWSHAVSYFMEPILASHDHSAFEIFAYPTVSRRDEVTQRIETLSDHWVPLAGLDDQAARDRIVADGIDVLVDLSGHTSGNRLGIFARRAAPVQAHYLGYYATTGLSSMDYWIGDPILTPPSADGDFTERIWRLPRLWISYHGKNDAPDPAWRPAADGTIWIGGFNRLEKLTPACLSLWARLLIALPEGRLLLKAKEFEDAGVRELLYSNFAERGVAVDRIELQGRGVTPNWASHMAYYDRLDIALDPIGAVGGGTTTCDALWMGVPVVGLEGNRMATRMTTAMLRALNHSEWLATDADDYIAKAVELARNVDQRLKLRHTQRDRMARSDLCDAHGLTRSLEDAFTVMVKYRKGAGT